MKDFKRKLTACIAALCIFVSGAAALQTEWVEAAVKQVNMPGEAVKDGKYIYYAYEMHGIRMGIMRWEPKKKTKKQIVSYLRNGKGTNGFYNLTISGNYIYATWDQFYGTSCSKNYIYRFSKKGGQKKQLAVGSQPIVIGKYIYYIQEKIVKADNRTEKTGYICRMNKNGSAKKRVCFYGKNKWVNLYASGSRVLYKDSTDASPFYDLKGSTYPSSAFNRNYLDSYYSVSPVKSGNYTYYLSSTPGSSYKNTKLCKKNIKTGKVKTIASFNGGILSVRILGNYIMLNGSAWKNPGNYTYGNQKLQVYCMNINGKAKKRLASWNPAE